MIHSRPGYAPMHGEQPKPAKLNEDMIPAINRKAPDHTAAQPKLNLEGRKVKNPPAAIPADVAAAAERSGAPDLILNPKPSAPPQVLSPGK
jgi:hypothetical protein